jgi:cytochrome P450
MTPKLNHEDETVFDNPSSFDPDRWDSVDAVAKKQYLGTFSKGNRNCLGRQ